MSETFNRLISPLCGSEIITRKSVTSSTLQEIDWKVILALKTIQILRFIAIFTKVFAKFIRCMIIYKQFVQ